MTAVLYGLWATVLVGAVVPVLPTGAAVSAAAAYSWHHEPASLPLVVVVGAAGGYLGDLVLFGAGRWGGQRLAARVRWLRDERAAAFAARLRERDLPLVLAGRLMPAGRLPVLAGAALAGLGWARFASVDAAACVLWAALYAGIGLAGGALFAQAWQGVLAAVLLVFLVWQTARTFTRPRRAGS